MSAEIKMSAKRNEELACYEVLDGENKGTRLYPPTKAELAKQGDQTAWRMTHNYGVQNGGLLFDQGVTADGADLFATSKNAATRFELTIPAGDAPASVMLKKFDNRTARGKALAARVGFGS